MLQTLSMPALISPFDHQHLFPRDLQSLRLTATFQSGFRSLPRERNAGTQEISPGAAEAADARYALQAVPEGSREPVSPLAPPIRFLCFSTIQGHITDSSLT